MASDLLLVSDFDGTLINTEDAVREAYARARGEKFSEEEWAAVWGRPWSDWCSREVKERKDRLYKESLIRHASLTAFGTIVNWNNLMILTGASRESVLLCIDMFFKRSSPNITVLSYNADTALKSAALRKLRPTDDGRSFYFDDDMKRGQEVCRGTGFTFCHVAGSTVTVFSRKRNTPWTRLSSLLDPMNVCAVSYLPITNRYS